MEFDPVHAKNVQSFWRILEYADCIPCIFWKTVGIWWWGSTSVDLKSVTYTFIAITLRSTLILRDCTC